MSNGYGIDLYGTVYYGYSQPIDYSVAPFTASQTEYNEINLTWLSPNATTWKYMELVRSVYGYTNSPADGQVVLSMTPSTPLRSFTDTGLTAGAIYYYTMFITLETPVWNSAATYVLNSVVLKNGIYYRALANNTNVDPPTNGNTWSLSTYAPNWLPAGYAATLVLGDEGYGTRLYDRTPQPYKIVTSDTFSNTSVDNPSLQHYLNVFGFGLSNIKTDYDSYLGLNNPDTVSADLLDILGQQLGVTTDYISTPQQRRQRIKNATVNYQLKGESQSIHNLIADIAGWDTTITQSTNTMPNIDAADFVHPKYDVWNPNTTYFVNQLIQYNGFNYRNLVQAVGPAQQPTGAATNNTWWAYQTQILDANTLRNPYTNGQSNWSLSLASGGTGAMQGVVSGVPFGTSNNANALAFTITNNTGYVNLQLAATWNTPNWSNASNYVVNNLVLYTDGIYYQALRASGPGTPYGFITPGTNNVYWKAIYHTTEIPTRTTDTVPIVQTPVWGTGVQYQTGDQVVYNGIIYQAVVDNIGSAPTGYYYSNGSWMYISYPLSTVTAGAWFANTSTNPLIFAISNADLRYYDINGNPITGLTGSGFTGLPLGYTARFVQDYTNLNNTTDPEVYGYAAYKSGSGTIAANDQVFWADPFFTTTANWKSAYGMAYVDPSQINARTYNFLNLRSYDGTNTPVADQDSNYYVTFATDFLDPLHYAHGLVFGYVDANNFFYATRKTFYKVVAGVETALASWTRLVDGDRMIMVVVGTAVSIYKYARDGQGTRILLGTATIPTVTGQYHGLIQKYSPSGAV